MSTVQERLSVLRYDPGSVDGILGDRTRYALWAFQRVNDLDEHGEIGPMTLAALAAPHNPAIRHADLGPRHVEIDLDRAVLALYDRDELRLITHVSAGSEVPFCENDICGDAITPVGVFRIMLKVPGWDDGPLGAMYNSMYFLPGYAIHGADSVPDYGVSHGCVRIPTHIATYVFDWLDIGDPIALDRSTMFSSKSPSIDGSTSLSCNPSV